MKRLGPVWLFFALLLVAPANAFGWGAGMHTALTGHGHDRMTERWKSAFDRNLLLYGSFGPDVWYILSDDFMELLCPIACGGDDGRISNECWGRYLDPDRYFAWTRHLIVNADSIELLSWAFGYGAHAVEDWRGHMEYIIPDWVNPNGTLYSRHTFIDSTGAALAFNVEGLHGYPTDFTLDRLAFGYPEGGYLTDANAESTGGRDENLGLAVGIREKSDGTRRAQWTAIVNEDATGLSPDGVCRISDAAAFGSASEGILAAAYGVTTYDSLGAKFPIVVEDGQVAKHCGTDYCQRMISDDGFGWPMACQVSKGAVSGLAQWHDYLKPADETGNDLVVDREKVALWMDRIAGEYTHGDVRMDDNAVFGINPETGLSEKHLYGVDNRDYTFGRSMPEIIGEVLELSVQDLVQRLFENPAMLGAVLQSDLPVLDKARFVAFGFHYRPRLAAWPDRMDYDGQNVALAPESPGPFASFSVPIDLRPEEANAAFEMVFPYYLAEIRCNPADFHGTGRLAVELLYRDEAGQVLARVGGFTWNPVDNSLDDPNGMAALVSEEEQQLLRIRLDNREGGWYAYPEGNVNAALSLEFSLEISDEASPPFDWIVDLALQPYCDAPDVNAPGEAAGDNSACPLAKPDFPEDEENEGADGDAEIMPDGDLEVSPDGDMDSEPQTDGDQEGTAIDGDLEPPGKSGGSGGGCDSTASHNTLVLWLLSLIALGAWRRRDFC